MFRRPILKLRVEGEKGRARVNVLFDTGSSVSAVREELAYKLDTPRRFPRPIPLDLATEEATVNVYEWVALDLWLNGRQLRGLFAVVKKLRMPVVVGTEYGDMWNLHIHVKDGRVSVEVREEEEDYEFVPKRAEGRGL